MEEVESRKKKREVTELYFNFSVFYFLTIILSSPFRDYNIITSFPPMHSSFNIFPCSFFLMSFKYVYFKSSHDKDRTPTCNPKYSEGCVQVKPGIHNKTLSQENKIIFKIILPLIH